MMIWVLGLVASLGRRPDPSPADAHHRITLPAAIRIARQAVGGGRPVRVGTDGNRLVVVVCRHNRPLQVEIQASGASYVVRQRSGDCEPRTLAAPHDFHSDAKRPTKRIVR